MELNVNCNGVFKIGLDKYAKERTHCKKFGAILDQISQFYQKTNHLIPDACIFTKIDSIKLNTIKNSKNQYNFFFIF